MSSFEFHGPDQKTYAACQYHADEIFSFSRGETAALQQKVTTVTQTERQLPPKSYVVFNLIAVFLTLPMSKQCD